MDSGAGILLVSLAILVSNFIVVYSLCHTLTNQQSNVYTHVLRLCGDFQCSNLSKSSSTTTCTHNAVVNVADIHVNTFEWIIQGTRKCSKMNYTNHRLIRSKQCKEIHSSIRFHANLLIRFSFHII